MLKISPHLATLTPRRNEENTMSFDLQFPANPTHIEHAPPWAPRQQNSAHVPAARSPGRRDGALRAPKTTAEGNPDAFTHEGTTHQLMRFYPGEEPAQPLTHRPGIAQLPTLTGTLPMPVMITAHTEHLIHVTFTDTTGEIMGTWCPATMVTPS